MRIRFVTKAQLQVLQASKTEKHLMPDGPIPLFGSLPSAVSRQWGGFSSVDSGTFVTMPLSANPLRVVVVDMNSDGNSLCMSTFDYAKGGFKVSGKRNDLTKTQLWGHWIAICD